MSGRGKTRNGASLPKGNSGVYGGTADSQPGDEMVGGWTRDQRERMDQAFAEAMARSLRTGRAASSSSAASSPTASVEPRRR